MLSTIIKEEPDSWDHIENQWNNIDYILNSQSPQIQIKLDFNKISETNNAHENEPSGCEMVAESLIDNADRPSLNILKEEIDVPNDEELSTNILNKYELENEEHDFFETNPINISWPSKTKHFHSDYHYKPGKNDVALKNARIVLEQISDSKRILKTNNTHQNVKKIKLISYVKYYCPECDKVNDHATAFYNPLNCRTCKKTMSLQCRKCNKVYSKPYSMYNHLKSQCYSEKMYECTKCNYKTRMLKSIGLHTRRMHSKNEGNFECSKCHKKLKNQYVLAKHTKYCNKAGRFSCTICPYKSHYKATLARHMKCHEKFKILVKQGETTANINVNRTDDGDVPDPNSKDKSKMNFNKYRVLNYFKRFCPLCVKTYENNSIRNLSHCQVCKSKLLMQCLKCNSSYKDRQLIQRHLKRCILKTYYKCPMCDHQTLWEQNLKSHIQRLHTTIDPEEYKKCPKCDKLFKIIDDLNKHAKTCGEDWYPYNCDHCFFRTKSKQRIRGHVQGHMKNRPIKIKKKTRTRKYHKAYCSKCDASRQIVPHSNMMCQNCKNLMVFKCRECAEDFPTRKDIRCHESENHGYVYHECRNCDKAFLRLSNFKEHKKVCKGGKSAGK